MPFALFRLDIRGGVAQAFHFDSKAVVGAAGNVEGEVRIAWFDAFGFHLPSLSFLRASSGIGDGKEHLQFGIARFH